jgi:hypothetical protein
MTNGLNLVLGLVDLFLVKNFDPMTSSDHPLNLLRALVAAIL